MKKLGMSLLVVLILCCLTACGGITHCKDCDDEIYEDGYCKYHYALHYADDAANGAFDAIFGN